MPKLQGRVFTRLEQYDALPAETKREIEAVQQHLTSIQTQVFEQHKLHLIKSAFGVKYKDLVEKIDAHLASGAATTGGASTNASSTTSTGVGRAADAVTHTGHGLEDVIAPEVSGDSIDQHADVTAEIENKIPTCQETDTHTEHGPLDDAIAPEVSGDSIDQHADVTAEIENTIPTAPAEFTNNVGAKPTLTAKLANAAALVKDKLTPSQSTETKQSTSFTGATSSTEPTTLETLKAKATGQVGDLHTTDRSKHLVKGLVLKGFITPYKEDEKLLDLETRESFDYKDTDLFVPLAVELREFTEPLTTVRDVAAGAIYANLVKRKASLVQKMMVGSELYAVVDKRSKALLLFSDDVGHSGPTIEIKADGARMAEDVTNFECGITVGNGTVTEVFNLSSTADRDAFVTALREIGIKGMEGVALSGRHASSEGPISKGIHNVTDKLTGMSVDDNMHNQDTNNTLKNERHIGQAPDGVMENYRHTTVNQPVQGQVGNSMMQGDQQRLDNQRSYGQGTADMMKNDRQATANQFGGGQENVSTSVLHP